MSGLEEKGPTATDLRRRALEALHGLEPIEELESEGVEGHERLEPEPTPAEGPWVGQVER